MRKRSHKNSRFTSQRNKSLQENKKKYLGVTNPSLGRVTCRMVRIFFRDFVRSYKRGLTLFWGSCESAAGYRDLRTLGLLPRADVPRHAPPEVNITGISYA